MDTLRAIKVVNQFLSTHNYPVDNDNTVSLSGYMNGNAVFHYKQYQGDSETPNPTGLPIYIITDGVSASLMTFNQVCQFLEGSQSVS